MAGNLPDFHVNKLIPYLKENLSCNCLAGVKTMRFKKKINFLNYENLIDNLFFKKQ